ncbi:Glycosyltransferase involved in cell wall bisynthesis [Fervidobacterium changbaicum]|uniref:Glycosyltransferase family 1 protein n=1 Tax=Fervidobacterium changbaicum TaxID=310769 RepID=A0ABX5QTN8_9BACT|nr:glycosyltransferase family 4 protein [Fervidobacterium changbaicum]QAV33754.1 glycosyltransferase family 1 protein [Fervidobacterium changbaicum]SDH31997.1 Glycosyltransferase involved in cell wall bisynthesis [Fervidobacterium changbaicum]
MGGGIDQGKSLRVLLAVTHAGFGGVAKHVIDLANLLREHGCKVDIATGSERNELMQEYERVSDNVIKLKYLKRSISLLDDILVFKEVEKVLKSSSYDIIHAHGPKAGFVFRLVAAKLSIPCVYTHHLIVYKQFKSLLNPLYKILEKIASSVGDHVIVVTKINKDILVSEKIVKPEKVSVVYNGLIDFSTKYTKKQAREKLNISPDDFVVVYVGRLEPPKDPLTLAKGFQDFCKRYNDGTKKYLFFVGDGPLKAKLPNDGNITVTGFTNDVELYLAAADVFCLTTTKEGLPISILEAMKYSLPIVATNVDGIAEQVFQRVNGFLVKPFFWQEISHALGEIYTNGELREKMAQESRRLSEERFDMRKNIVQILHIYRSITENYSISKKSLR